MSSSLLYSPATLPMALRQSSKQLGRALQPSLRSFRCAPRVVAQAESNEGDQVAVQRQQSQAPARQQQQQYSRALSPFTSSPMSALLPGRFNRLFRDLEEEVNSLTRGFWGDLDRDFMTTSSNLSPIMGPGFGATDVKETDSAYELHVDVPSLTKDDVKVNLDRNGVLTISGERQSSSEEEKDNFKRVERVYGTFTRRFQVPDNVDKDKIAAKVENGVLRLELPKAAEGATHEHTITVE